MSRPSYVQTVAPTLPAVTLAEAKEHLREDSEDNNQLITDLVEAATSYAQDYQWSQLVSATYEMRLDRFCDLIELHPNPVSSVTSVAYVDSAGASQTLVANTDYVVDIKQKPARLVPAYGKSWPATRGFLNDVTITLVAGYGTPTSVPRKIKQAILLLVGHWFRNRESMGDAGKDIGFATKALLDMNTFRGFL